ncbi:MAG: hypothetical protein QM737_03815 [Ferruginibacter sp.]
MVFYISRKDVKIAKLQKPLRTLRFFAPLREVLFTFFLLSSCNVQDSSKTKLQQFSINTSDTALHLINGELFYRNQPFNGELKEAWPNAKLKSIERYSNGKQQDLSEAFYPNGDRESTRWYNKGEKDSVHTGWWENGNKRYEYHFNKGNYNGMFTEWYQTGKMMQQVMYANGKELYGKGWRENGKLYMNFVMKDGRRFGMNNSNLCYGLKSEKVVER